MHQLDHPLDRTRQRFQPARHIGLDERALSGEGGDEFCRGFSSRTPRIVLEMPFRRHDIGAKPLEPVPIRDQLFVKKARVPVIKNAADIKDDSVDRSFGQQRKIQP